MMTTRRTLLRAGGWAAGLALIGLPAAAPAAPVVEIRMRGSTDGSRVWFDPIGVLVEPGQTLRWINEDPGNSHTSTAYHPANAGHPLRIPQGAAPWNSDYLLPEQSFELRLTAPGVYDYFCVPHEEAGMVGRIVVGRIRSTPPAATLPEPARRLLPSAEEIVRRKRICAAGGHLCQAPAGSGEMTEDDTARLHGRVQAEGCGNSTQPAGTRRAGWVEARQTGSRTSAIP